MELDASPTFLSVVKNQIKKSTLKKWQRAWRLPDNKRSLNTICPSVPVRRLKSSSSTKSQDSTWIRVITEHNRLNDHMFRIGLSETRLCECGEAQTAAHVLMDCHLDSADREAMLGVIKLSFVKCNLPIHERTLNLSSLLWPELYINQCSQTVISEVHISDQHKSQFLDCHKWNRDLSVIICEIYHKPSIRAIIFIPECHNLRDQYWARKRSSLDNNNNIGDARRDKLNFSCLWWRLKCQ